MTNTHVKTDALLLLEIKATQKTEFSDRLGAHIPAWTHPRSPRAQRAAEVKQALFISHIDAANSGFFCSSGGLVMQKPAYLCLQIQKKMLSG